MAGEAGAGESATQAGDQVSKSRLREAASDHARRPCRDEQTGAPRRYNKPMPQHSDVLVLGGGVIGLTTAYFLAREQVSVTVVDKGDFGQEASWAGAGILTPGNLAHARGTTRHSK